MSSMMAAAAIGAMMTGAGVARSPARAAISPQERSGAIQIYRIPAGSMAAALNVIADENDLHVLYDARLTDGLTTAGLSGAYSVRDALGSLLSGTRLSYEFSRDGHSVSIVLAQADTMRNDAGAEALPPIDIGAEEKARDERNGRPIDASRLRLEPKTPTEAYVVRSAETATKTDTPVKDIPASIQVVPKQILTDQQVTNLTQAVDNVSGVHANNFDGITSLFYMRGFKTNYIFRNSLPLPQLDGTPQLVDTAYVERIEVLKGPSSILYGRTEPGGLINIVTKQPLDQPLYRVDQQIGSYDHYRTQWDFSAPVKEIPGLAYRISGAYQDNGSFRQFNGGRRAVLAPVVRYSPTPWTEVTIDSQLLTSRIQNDAGLPSGSQFGPLLAQIPHTRSLQEANDPRDINDSFSIGYNIRQNLAEDWKITNRFRYNQGHWASNQLAGAGLQNNLTTANRISQVNDSSSHTFATNIDLNGRFDAIGGAHNFLFGLDYLNHEINYYYGNGSSNYQINIYAPVYGSVANYAFYDAVLGGGFKFHSSTALRQKGMYVQDYITWFDSLHLLVGARYDIADITVGRSISDYSGGPELIYAPSKSSAFNDRLRRPTQISTGWSPRVGVVYDFLPELSAFVSYSRSFGQYGGFDPAAGKLFPPEKGLQWEFGLKAQPLSGVLATMSFFQITKSGVSTGLFGSVQASQQAGLQRSRGVELDVIGAVTDRMSVLANYAYTDAKVISDDPPNPLNPFGMLNPAVYGAKGGLLGNHLEFAPRHSGKLFVTYDFGENGLGFRVGGGVTASTHWWGDIQNTFLMPSYARLDGFVSYTAELSGHRITAKLNLQNINNVRYFDAVDSYVNVFSPPYYRIPARPFQAVGTVGFQW